MTFLLIKLFLVALIVTIGQAAIKDKCEIVKALRAQKVPENKLSDCMFIVSVVSVK